MCQKCCVLQTFPYLSSCFVISVVAEFCNPNICNAGVHCIFFFIKDFGEKCFLLLEGHEKYCASCGMQNPCPSIYFVSGEKWLQIKTTPWHQNNATWYTRLPGPRMGKMTYIPEKWFLKMHYIDSFVVTSWGNRVEQNFSNTFPIKT